MTWTVVTEPEGKNPGIIGKAKGAVTGGSSENLSGIIIYLVNGASKQEVSRVAFVRRASKHPHVDFKTQLAKELEKAHHAADVLNGTMNAGVLA